MALDKETALPQVRPGLEIPTHLGKWTALYPERAGHPEGNWIGVLCDGHTITLTREEICNSARPGE